MIWKLSADGELAKIRNGFSCYFIHLSTWQQNSAESTLPEGESCTRWCYTPLSVDDNGYTPLMAAASYGHVELLEFFLSSMRNPTFLSNVLAVERDMIKEMPLTPGDTSTDSAYLRARHRRRGGGFDTRAVTPLTEGPAGALIAPMQRMLDALERPLKQAMLSEEKTLELSDLLPILKFADLDGDTIYHHFALAVPDIKCEEDRGQILKQLWSLLSPVPNPPSAYEAVALLINNEGQSPFESALAEIGLEEIHDDHNDIVAAVRWFFEKHGRDMPTTFFEKPAGGLPLLLGTGSDDDLEDKGKSAQSGGSDN